MHVEVVIYKKVFRWPIRSIASVGTALRGRERLDDGTAEEEENDGGTRKTGRRDAETAGGEEHDGTTGRRDGGKRRGTSTKDRSTFRGQ